ncbi:hypothetical protein E5D57_013461 [Metarhizium anisopliae]|nr:hypothetical protein E5D57_013461 [Metarhizium anisopliae]
MTKALKQAIRAILPTWKTTPIAVLHRESGIPPVHQLLEARRLRFSARIKSLDHAHPLAKRTTEAAPRPIIKCIKLKYQLPPKSFPTRLRRTNRLLGSCQRPVLIPRKYSHEPQQPLQTASKEESAKDFDRWLQTIPPLSLIVYSDGSLSPSGAAGYGYAVHQNRRSVCQGAGRLGPAEVFDAEAKGALEGLKAALRLPQSATQRIVPSTSCAPLGDLSGLRPLDGKYTYIHTYSPTRSLTAYDRDRGHGRNRLLDTGTQDSTTNRFAALAEEDDATETPTPVFDLEAKTEEIIKTQKERLDIRAKVLRTYAEAITACTRKFTTGYGLHIANEFQNTLLRHWNQFVRAEEPLIPGNKNTPAPSSLTGTNKPTPPAPAARENTRSDKLVSFANIAKNASRQAPGDVHVHPHRRQTTTIADRNDRRVLLRLKSGSSFFEKGLQIRLALKDKLAIASQDIQDIKPTNTGWAIVARNEKIQQLILEKQNEWGPCIDLDIAEKQISHLPDQKLPQDSPLMGRYRSEFRGNC